MNLDDQICYCYHVPLRKLLHFARRTRPSHASQMSECLGAGTGCGWCIPILKRVHAAVCTQRDAAAPGAMTEAAALPLINDLPDTAADYAAARQNYIRTQQPKNRFDESSGPEQSRPA